MPSETSDSNSTPTSRAGSETAGKTTVQVGDRRLVISNLGKILYPQTGFTKGEVLDYYARIAPVLLPHLAGRLAAHPSGCAPSTCRFRAAR